jgi:tetratricopeptide (TPR) repeat protein
MNRVRKSSSRWRKILGEPLGLALLLVCIGATSHAEDDPTILRLLDEGGRALQSGDIDTAFSSFRKILVLQPDHPEAYFRLGQVFINKGDYAKAEEVLLKTTELDPLNARYAINLGNFYEQTGRRPEALEEYQRIIDSGTRDARVKEAEKRLSLATGQALAKKGEMNAALLIFNGLLLDYPDDPIILANIGATYVFLNRTEEAENTFRRLVGIDPRHSIGHMNLANIYERTGRPEDAMRHLQKIIDLNPDPGMTKEAKIRYGIINGREYLRRQDWPNAVQVFQQVINLDPKRTEAFFNIALANLSLGNVDMAEKGFLSVLKVTPGDFSARLNLGSLYADTNRLDKAKEQFQFVIDNDSGRYAKDASARMNKIHTMVADKALAEGKVEESLREYEKALDYFSGNVKASFNRGLIFIKARKYEEARAEFEMVVQHDPQNTRGRINLANIYEQLGQMTKAAEQYEIVMQLDRNSKEGRVASAKWKITKARGLWAERKLTASERIFEEIVEEQPSNVEALFYLGTIQSSKGKLEEAAGAYQRILDIRPNNQRVRVLLAKVYEQLGLDQLAANEYQFVIFNGAPREVLNEATLRLSSVENRLSGFSNTFNYSFLYDDNANMNNDDPSTEFRSDLALNVTYSQSLLNDLSYKITLSPTYSSLHVSETDYLNSNIFATLTKGSPKNNFSLRFGQQDQQSVVVEQDVSRSSTFLFSNTRTLYLPAFMGLAPPGFEGENISTGFSLNGSIRNIESFARAKLFSYTGSLGVSFNQALARGIRGSIGYQLIVNWIPEDKHVELIEENVSIERDPLTGLDVPVRGSGDLVLYDSKDYVYNGHSVNLTIARVLAPGVSGTITTSAMYLGYLNDDSGSVALGDPQKRQNLNLTANVRISYNFFKDISFYVSAMAQQNLSSLKTGFSAQTTSDAVSSFQSTSLGDVRRFNVSSGFTMQF